MKIIFALLLSLFAGLASADIGAGAPLSPVSPSYVMPAGKFYVNSDLIPKRRFGRTSEVVVTTAIAPGFAAGGTVMRGDFRISCPFSHAAFDDPIVWPGQAGRTHLHQFFGNTSTRSSSDIANMATTGNSTCVGGTTNRSGYWIPVLIYHCPAGSTNGCTSARDGEPLFASGGNFYYKSPDSFGTDYGSYGGLPVQWPPIGFRMISGDTNRRVAVPGIQFRCLLANVEKVDTSNIPTTAQATGGGGCDQLKIGVNMQRCWDGVNLDSPDHSSHVTNSPANFNDATGCTNPAFPIAFPFITFNILTNVNISDLDYLRLSSDIPLAVAKLDSVNCSAANNWCAGFSLHGDWVNGWSNNSNYQGFGKGSITDIIRKNCWGQGRPSGPFGVVDCSNHLLGDILGNGVYWTLE